MQFGVWFIPTEIFCCFQLCSIPNFDERSGHKGYLCKIHDSPEFICELFHQKDILSENCFTNSFLYAGCNPVDLRDATVFTGKVNLTI